MSEPLHEEIRFYSEPLMGELSQLLEERQLVSPDQMQEVMSRQTLTGTPMYRLLIEEALLAEDQVLGLVSELTGLRFAHLADVEVDPEASKAIHARVAHRYQIIQVAVTTRAEDRDHGRKAQRINTHSRWFFPAIFVGLMAMTFWVG